MKVIIFGASGAIGKGLIDVILKNQPTWQVYAVTRDISTAKFTTAPNVNLLEGDPNRREDVMQLSADKDIIYSCIGLAKYEAKHWAEHWPIIIGNLLEGSSQKPGQKFVFCDNLYAYGPGKDVSPRSTIVGPSKKSKPGVRAIIRPLLQERMDRDPSSISVVGAADFFGPDVTSNSFLGDTFTKAIVAGKPRPLILASSSKIHDFCFGKDFSNALYVASIDSRAAGKFWIAPHCIHGKTVQDIANDIARIADSTNQKVMVLPGWLIRLASPLDSFFKEMVEMLKFWNEDYTVDDSDFCKVFNVEPTPYDKALEEYVQFYRSLQEKKA